MSKKKIAGCSIIVLLLAVISGYFIYNRMYPDDYKVSEDEIALRVQLDIEEDIGLLVYDYNIAGHDYGGGMSNADRSMIRHDEELIVTWDEEQIRLVSGQESLPEELPFCMTFRIITEYVDPNYENNYPEDITVRLDPIEWIAHLGNEYRIRITGDKTNGYNAVFE